MNILYQSLFTERPTTLKILQHAMFSEISKLNLFFHFSILKDFSAAFISLSGRGADNACTTVNLTQMSMIYMCDQ